MRRSAFLAAALLLPSHGWSFHSVPDGGSHAKITTDAINIQISPTDYPDIHRFKSILIGSSYDESSHEDLWFGDPESWQTRSFTQFDLKNYREAYRMQGMALHLFQDAQSPAHIKINRHGTDMITGALPIDGLENFARTSHFYNSTANPPWRNLDADGNEWAYWLNDSEDDDDHNETAADANDGTSLDGRDGITSFGVSSTWGTYGKGVIDLVPAPPDFTDRLPGNDEGFDWYDGTVQDANIAHRQLFNALERTRLELKALSESQPTRVRLKTKESSVIGRMVVLSKPSTDGGLFKCILTQSCISF